MTIKEKYGRHIASIAVVLGILTYGIMIVAAGARIFGFVDWSWWWILSPLWICGGIIVILVIIYHVWNAYIKYVNRGMKEFGNFPQRGAAPVPSIALQTEVLRQVEKIGEADITVDFISNHFGNLERFTKWANENNISVLPEHSHIHRLIKATNV